MKKHSLLLVSSFALVLGSMSLVSCGNNSTSSSVVSSSSVEPIVPGETSVTLTGADRGVAVGATLPLHCTVFGPNAKVHFTSSDETIAAVSEDGVVTGVKPGFVSIRATSAISEASYGSYTLFVEPAYIASLVKGFRGNDYASGLSFAGKLAFMPSPASASSTEEKSSLLAPFSFALQNQTHAFSSGDGSYTLPSFDLQVQPDSSVVSIVDMVIGKSGYKAKNFSLASLDLGSPVFYSEENSDASLFGLYQPFSFWSKISSLIPEVSTLADSMPSVMAAASNLSAYLETLAVTLNKNLSFSNDESEGIAIKDEAIVALNKKWPSILEGIESSKTLPSPLPVLLPAMLPESFKDIRFSVSSKDGAFAGLKLLITGVKKSGSDKVDTVYHPLTITLQSPSAISSTYFSDLKARFLIADTDVSLLAKLTTAESNLHTLLNAYNMDLYDTINHCGKFVTALKRYNTKTYPLLSQIVNTPMIPSVHSDDSSTLSFVYGPYEAFSVTRALDSESNVLMDRYAPNAGEAFTLSEVTPCGNSETAFASAPTYQFALSDDTLTASDYVSLEGNTLTIKKLPSENKLTLTLTPSAVEGYVPLTYTMVLNPVKA